MIKYLLLFLLLTSSTNYSQEIINISISKQGSELLAPSYNYDGSIYISLKHLSNAVDAGYNYDRNTGKIVIRFSKYTLTATANNPYLIVKENATGKFKTFQLPTSIHLVGSQLFVPLNSVLNIFNQISDARIAIISPGKLFIKEKTNLFGNELLNVQVENQKDQSDVKVETINRAKYSIQRYNKNTYYILLRNSSIFPDVKKHLISTGIVNEINIEEFGKDVLLKIKFSDVSTALDIIEAPNKSEVSFRFFKREKSGWYEKESKHFKVIYRESHAHLVNHILSSAENALRRLRTIFNYTPTEKIVINTYDVSDYGFGATTTVPQNYIRLEIESLEPGYEAVLYNERIQWLISHELVHIVVNDQASSLENAFRSIFGKVPPEKIQPFTIIYSILTNFTRYSPRWYQEGIAVFMETWLSGGYGRTLGNFDEMYFRTLVFEGKQIPSYWDIETILTHNSIFLQSIYYFYGTRFVSYLAIKYGVQKLINWYKTYPNQNLQGFIGKFKEVFNLNFYAAWDDFAKTEVTFQKENLRILKGANLTKTRTLTPDVFGWVTDPYFDQRTLSIIYGYHRSGHLATLQKFHLLTKESEDIVTLPTPSMFQVASTAFDENNNLFFFTTNNNRLFRDVWVVDLRTRDKKILFPDSRIGNITVSSSTHDLWGVQQRGGISTLIVSPYPYNSLIPVMSFNFGEELSHLAVTPSGKKLAAVLHRATGEQSIIIFNTKDLVEDGPVSFETITSSGSPENPSWNKDESTLFWNAYTNGVSNIYRYDFNDSAKVALTNCLTGIFKPIALSPDSLFAFKFTLDGFVPVIIANKKADYLPAIHYYGQKILDKDPEVINWVLKDAEKSVNQKSFTKEKPYNPLANLHLHSLVPVISGFQSQIVLGVFTHISDPLLIHDFTMEIGVSPFNETPSYPFFHLSLKYNYLQRFFIEYVYNGADFFDLFNSRKRGMIGSKFKLGNYYYWLYDKPHTIKQSTSLTLFRGVEFINDNLVRVSQPDFLVLATNITSKYLRRTIGSSDYEQGNTISLTFTLYATKFENPQFLPNSYLEYDRYLLWIANHNVLHLKLAGGYLLDNESVIQGKFYFGGFGNRAVDNGLIRQFRKVFRYPGLPIYSLMTGKFFKFMLENDFPPIRVSGWALWNQYINHFDFSIYSQTLITQSDIGNYWVDLGAQMDIKFKHWFNLESTLSAGIAKAWSEKMNNWEWFISLKLLKD
ncbi:hypothetical protein BMS3Abin03_02579 [bacterium BMS3Abin03]|nr:hypothetical protein BMS3Abin03_02579 [bacterium BMS3Abin03]